MRTGGRSVHPFTVLFLMVTVGVGVDGAIARADDRPVPVGLSSGPKSLGASVLTCMRLMFRSRFQKYSTEKTAFLTADLTQYSRDLASKDAFEDFYKSVSMKFVRDPNLDLGAIQGAPEVTFEEFGEWIRAKRYAEIFDNLPLLSQSSVWLTQLFPDYGWDRYVMIRQIPAPVGTAFGDLEGVRNYVTQSVIEDPERLKAFRSRLTSIRKSSPKLLAEEIKSASGELPVLCAQYVRVDRVGACVESLRAILRLMKPEIITVNSATSMTVSALPLYEKLIPDPLFQKGLGFAADAILKRIDRVDHLDPLGSADWFEDLRDAFKAAGASPARSEELTWDLLGLIATRGPDIGITTRNMFGKDLPDLLAERLHVIAAGATVLDQYAFSRGKKAYSYPPELHSAVDTRKTYHFWMSAYFAHRFGAKSSDPVGAAAAAFLSDVGYNMKSITAGRKPYMPFLIESFDSYNNKMRFDLSYAAVGAMYGSRPPGVSLDYEILLKKWVAHNPEVDPLLPEDAVNLWKGLGLQGFIEWTARFRPRELFRSALEM